LPDCQMRTLNQIDMNAHLARIAAWGVWVAAT
jgi:hypothetical protein